VRDSAFVFVDALIHQFSKALAIVREWHDLSLINIVLDYEFVVPVLLKRTEDTVRIYLSSRGISRSRISRSAFLFHSLWICYSLYYNVLQSSNVLQARDLS